MLFLTFYSVGDPYEIRTRVAGVRGRSLRPLDQRAKYILTLSRLSRFVHRMPDARLVHHQGLEPGTP